jgi:uncharacterized protein RhaS with RHS repeats
VLEHFTYAYNNANHITSRTDTNGDVTTFGYDNAVPPRIRIFIKVPFYAA